MKEKHFERYRKVFKTPEEASAFAADVLMDTGIVLEVRETYKDVTHQYPTRE